MGLADLWHLELRAKGLTLENRGETRIYAREVFSGSENLRVCVMKGLCERNTALLWEKRPRICEV